MVRIYLLGGADIKKGVSKPICRRAVKETGKTPSVLVFPWTSRIEMRKYRKIMDRYLKGCGARKVKFGELTDSFQKLQRKISLSDVIYLPGGDPNILTKRITRAGMIPLLKNYRGVIIGNSAGSLALCTRYAVIKGQDGEPKTKLTRGLGIVDFPVSVHYKSKKKEYSGNKPDKELKTLSEKTNSPIYAIPEDSALIYDEGNLKFIGNVHLFNNIEKPKVSKTS